MKKKQRQKNYFKTRNIFCGALSLLGLTFVNAQQPNFPFDAINGNASTFRATINVNSGQGTSLFNNHLLGSNVDINTRGTGRQSRGPGPSERSNQGFFAPVLQDHLNAHDPVVIRFPQGVFGNTYNWRDKTVNGVFFPEDTRNASDPILEDDPQNRRASEFTTSPASLRLGYPALRGIFDRAERRGKPLDLLTVLNMIEDNQFSSRDRIRSMREDGFTVRDVELGNEFFFLGQRSATIDTEVAWVERAAEVVRVLRRNNDTGTRMRFGIPISFRGETEARHQQYNRDIVGDQSFFDAIVVHRYVRVREQARQNPIPAANLSPAELRGLLTASDSLRNSIDFCKRQVNPDKRRVWLTEWGVSGGIEGEIGASVLGMADTYLDLLRRSDMDRINLFSTFGLNEQYTFPNNGTTSVATGYGRVYELFTEVLRDQELFNNPIVTSPRLEVNNQRQRAQAINAVATRINGRINLLIVNKGDITGQVFLRTNGNERRNYSYTVQGVRFPNLQTNAIADVDVTRRNRSVIDVPAFSVVSVNIDFSNSAKSASAKISETLEDATVITAFPNPSSGVFNLNRSGNWEAFTLQGARIRSGNGDTVDLTGVASGLYILRIEGQMLRLSVE
jgi:hypothetical protein